MTHPVISLKPSYNSIIRGCPGLPETLPRLECELRIRSSDGKELYIENVQVILKTTEALNSSGHSFSTKPKIEKFTTHYKKTIMVSNKKIIGIDIPLTIAVPDDIKETNYNARFGHCFTTLECRAVYLSTDTTVPGVQVFSTAVNVERYDIIASPRLSQPLRRTHQSPDHRVQVKYKVENPCVTTDDLLRLHLQIIPKLSSHASQKIFQKKLKLKAVVFELKEYLESFDARYDPKENVLHTVTKPINEVLLDSGIDFKQDVRTLTKNMQFRQYEMSLNEPAVLYRLPTHEPILTEAPPETVLLKSKNELEPFRYHNSITTRGKLFSVTHGITMRFKIGNAKDFEIHQPLDVSPWTKSQLKYLDNVVSRETELARNARAFYDTFGGIRRSKNSGKLEYPPLPPVVYTSDRRTLKELGIEFNTTLKSPQRIPIIE